MPVKLVCGPRAGARRAPRTRALTCALAPPLALALASLATAARAEAQAVSVGAAVGLGRVPVKYFPNCGVGNGQEGALVADLRAGMRLTAHVGVEARLGSYVTGMFAGCAIAFSPPPEGISTRPDYPFSQEGTSSLDLRLRYEPLPVLTVTAGAGWLRAVHTPYVVLGPGIRAGGRVRLIIDDEVLFARFPYDMVTREAHAGQIVREISRSSGHEWRHLTSARAGLDVGLGPRPH